MMEEHVGRLDLAGQVSDDVVDDQRILTDLRLRTDLSAEEQSIFTGYVRGLAAGVDPEMPV